MSLLGFLFAPSRRIFAMDALDSTFLQMGINKNPSANDSHGLYGRRNHKKTCVLPLLFVLHWHVVVRAF